MKAPDKIYLTSTPYRILDGWCDSKTPYASGIEQIEYIRKDALLEWAKELTSKPYDGTTESAHKHQIANYLLEKYNSL